MAEARRWIAQLAASGQPSRGALRAFARLRKPVEQPPPSRIQEVLLWPLAEPVEGIPNSVVTAGQGPGARFEGKDAAALRNIRARTSRMRQIADLYPSSSYVSDCGEGYQLELRDELPDVIGRQLATFLEDAWHRPALVSCRDWRGNSLACSIR